jgi:hypothetical protein
MAHECQIPFFYENSSLPPLRMSTWATIMQVQSLIDLATTLFYKGNLNYTWWLTSKLESWWSIRQVTLQHYEPLLKSFPFRISNSMVYKVSKMLWNLCMAYYKYVVD